MKSSRECSVLVFYFAVVIYIYCHQGYLQESLFRLYISRALESMVPVWRGQAAGAQGSS